MGLDVYLYKAKTIPTNDDMNDENEKAFKEEGVETPSLRYPKHYFKIGYFRSSYNESGINTVLGNAIGTDLYDIFDVGADSYVVSPNWEMALIKVNKAIKDYTELIESPMGKYSVTTIHNFTRGNVKNPKEALDVFREELEKKKKDDRTFDSYICSLGNFYLGSPLKVAGIISGSGTGFREGETYVIYEMDKEAEGDFYLQALEIVQETIEYVLAQKDKLKYYLHWSG